MFAFRLSTTLIMSALSLLFFLIEGCQWAKVSTLPPPATYEITEQLQGVWVECEWSHVFLKEGTKGFTPELLPFDLRIPDEKKAFEESRIVYSRAEADGELIVGCTFWNSEKGIFEVRNHELFVSQVNAINLAFCKSESKSGYWFVKYVIHENGLLTIYLPKFNLLKDAIKMESIVGRAIRNNQEGEGFMLDPKVLTEYLSSTKSPDELFEAEPVATLQKLK